MLVKATRRKRKRRLSSLPRFASNQQAIELGLVRASMDIPKQLEPKPNNVLEFKKNGF